MLDYLEHTYGTFFSHALLPNGNAFLRHSNIVPVKRLHDFNCSHANFCPFKASAPAWPGTLIS